MRFASARLGLLVDVGHEDRHEDAERREAHDHGEIDADDGHDFGRRWHFLGHHEHKDTVGDEAREAEADFLA